MRRFAPLLALALVATCGLSARADLFYQQTNLVSDVPGMAAHLDANLKNPWGMSFGPTSPFWVSDQVTGVSTLYNSQGVQVPLIVTIPPSPTGRPTGQVFNSTASDFALPVGGKSTFLFASLNGTINGWNGPSGTTAQQVFAATNGAVYTGLALANNGAANFLYAADARNGHVDVFNSSFGLTTLAGTFSDPNLPTGFVPYNIHFLGGKLYVTYENRTAHGGVVDVFDTNGNLLQRFADNPAGGHLDDPWGVALAPSTFGPLGGSLLIGNKGNGHINAFDPVTGAFRGELLDGNGAPLANTGLWEIAFGNAGNNGDPNTLFFVAGINNETNGLFGSIRAVPEPASIALMVVGGVGLGGMLRLRRRAA